MAASPCATSVSQVKTPASGLSFNEALALARAEINLTHKLKDKQIEVLSHLYDGKDTVALLPTGFGKSLIYQISPFLLKHRSNWSGKNPICIVISPLNAIMKEQIIKLGSMGISACGLDVSAEAGMTWTEIVDDLPPEEEDDAEEENVVSDSPTGKFYITNASMSDVQDGKFNIVFAHPEALLSSKEGQSLMRSQVYQENVVCISVDEAHLVQEWGESFRIDFLRINEIVTLFDSSPHLVLTATASPSAVRNMVKKLQLQDPIILKTSPDRPNIKYMTELRSNDNYAGLQQIIEPLAKELTEKGEIFPLTILYTDKESIQFCYRFFKHMVPDSVGYCGEILAENRRYAQFHQQYTEEMKLHIIRDLTQATPVIRIVFATVALGMGLDARSIRRVIHFKAPRSIEQYMQETGRAGRDGLSAEVFLYYNGRDLSDGREGLQPQMIKYCTSTDECLRGLLLSHFGHTMKQNRGPTCCSICAKKALSSGK